MPPGVKQPEGDLVYHVSPSENRSSILRHGLDATRMTGRGIAGSTSPEVEGVYLATSLDEAWWFASFNTHDRFDVWAVDATNLALVSSPHGHDYFPGSIAPERIRLLEADVDPAEMWTRLSESGGPDDATGGLTGDIGIAFRRHDQGDR